MKKLILLGMILLIPSVLAEVMEQCENPITPQDIPCNIISTWEYDSCGAAEFKIYNDTPTLLATRTFSDFGTSQRCNFTWNISTIGSYFWNVSNGDSGRILVEVDETMGFAVVFGLSLFSVAFIILGIWLLTRKEDASGSH